MAGTMPEPELPLQNIIDRADGEDVLGSSADIAAVGEHQIGGLQKFSAGRLPLGNDQHPAVAPAA